MAGNITINYYASDSATTPCYTTTTLEHNSANEIYFQLYDYNDALLANCPTPE